MLFGGADYTTGSHSDTWTWNGTTWNQLSVSGAPAQSLGAMAALDGTLVLYGGEGSTAVASSPLSIWNGTQWAEVNVPDPSATVLVAMAPLHDRVVLFGGFSASLALLGETWFWDGTAWAPSTSQGHPPVPSPSWGHRRRHGGPLRRRGAARRCPALGHLD